MSPKKRELKQPEITKVCPTCNAKMKSYRQEQQHCNGYWNQVYTFDCGCMIRFSPNFMAEITEDPCPNDPMIMEANNRFKKEMVWICVFCLSYCRGKNKKNFKSRGFSCRLPALLIEMPLP